MHVNIEKIKLFAKDWFERGIGKTRMEDECNSYSEGIEDGILTALESFGHTSMAVYEANSIGSKLDEYLYELRNDG